MEEMLLAIIIIGRNEESNLPEVFDSVKKAARNLNTEFGELPEILYIDSRSTDASIRIAHESGIQSYVVEGDLSPGISRNLGALKSTSKYIFFLDGDTVLTEDFLVHGSNFSFELQLIVNTSFKFRSCWSELPFLFAQKT